MPCTVQQQCWALQGGLPPSPSSVLTPTDTRMASHPWFDCISCMTPFGLIIPVQSMQLICLHWSTPPTIDASCNHCAPFSASDKTPTSKGSPKLLVQCMCVGTLHTPRPPSTPPSHPHPLPIAHGHLPPLTMIFQMHSTSTAWN